MSTRRKTQRKVIKIIVILIGILLIIKLSRDILRLLKSGEQVKLAQDQVQLLEEEKQVLLEKYQYYQSDEFIEEEARNKLNMARPGETIVILPPNVGELVGRTNSQPEPEIPNWQKWYQLFF